MPISVMDAAGDVPDALSKNPINEVCELLEAAHGSKFVIFLLNNRQFDESRIRGQVCISQYLLCFRSAFQISYSMSLICILDVSSAFIALFCHCSDFSSLVFLFMLCQVARCGWQPRSTPRLAQILTFCRSVHKYLIQSSKGVAVIHCEVCSYFRC